MKQREIKFRAWDNVNKIILYPKVIKESFTTISSGDLLNRYEFIMQYTGLKDKNGVEIYEGDILEIKASWGTYKAIVKYGLIGKDVEHHAAFGYYIPNEDGEEESYYLTLIDIFTSDEVVIGNIYETPELLK